MMPEFVMYDDANDEMVDLTDASVILMDSESDSLVDFEALPNGRGIRILFNLDLVSVHQQNDGDMIVQLKKTP